MEPFARQHRVSRNNTRVTEKPLLSHLKSRSRLANSAKFNIQLCTRDGRLLAEYSLSQQGDKVRTLGAAERHVRKSLSQQSGEPVIVVISEQTRGGVHQSQSLMSFDVAKPDRLDASADQ